MTHFPLSLSKFFPCFSLVKYFFQIQNITQLKNIILCSHAETGILYMLTECVIPPDSFQCLVKPQCDRLCDTPNSFVNYKSLF